LSYVSIRQHRSAFVYVYIPGIRQVEKGAADDIVPDNSRHIFCDESVYHAHTEPKVHRLPDVCL
jgi:hypothetical protein